MRRKEEPSSAPKFLLLEQTSIKPKRLLLVIQVHDVVRADTCHDRLGGCVRIAELTDH